MRKLIIIGCAMIGLSTAPVWAEVDIEGQGETHTIDCSKDAALVVSGAKNTITLTGACKSIEMTGTGNSLTVESVERLEINGTENTVAAVALSAVELTGVKNKVTWKTSPTKRKKPSVSNTGVKNSVKKIK